MYFANRFATTTLYSVLAAAALTLGATGAAVAAGFGSNSTASDYGTSSGQMLDTKDKSSTSSDGYGVSRPGGQSQGGPLGGMSGGMSGSGSGSTSGSLNIGSSDKEDSGNSGSSNSGFGSSGY